MANENRFDSGIGHVVLPVQHPNGEVHNIAVPPDTDLGDFHAALSEYEHQPMPVQQPTAEGSIEHSEAFKKAARDAWSNVGYGDLPQESGFLVDKNGTPGKMVQGAEIGSQATTGSTTFQIPPGGVFATLHTHPRETMNKKWIQQPSQPDVDVAKNSRQNVYVVTSSGLWLAEPNGQVSQVFKNNDWMKAKKR
jgi:hypothetical protein